MALVALSKLCVIYSVKDVNMTKAKDSKKNEDAQAKPAKKAAAKKPPAKKAAGKETVKKAQNRVVRNIPDRG